MGRGHYRDRPADLSVSRRGAGGADRRGEPRLLRRDRADRLSRHDRFRRGVVPVALRQGRGSRLHQLPARSRAIRGVRRGAAGRREDRVPRMGEIDAVFRRLPAGRDHGVARSGHAALGADEAGRPARPAHRKAAACRRAAAPGQCAGHALQHGRLPDEAAPRRAEAHLPHDPRAGARRVRPARRAAPQHLPQQPAPARRRAAPPGDAAAALRRPDHRGGRLRRERRDRPVGGQLRGGVTARP